MGLSDTDTTLASTKLALYSGAAFKPNSSYFVTDLIIHAEDDSVTYDGDLNMTKGNIDFYGSLDNNNHTLLKVTGDVSVTNITYNIYLDGDSELQEGMTYTLIAAGEGRDFSFNAKLQNVQVGSTVQYSLNTNAQTTEDGAFNFQFTDVQIIKEDEGGDSSESTTPGSGSSSSGHNFSIGKGHARSEAKVLLEGSLASLTLVNEGADLIATSGMNAMNRAVKSSTLAPAPFIAVQGGYQQYDSGSHIDIRTISLLAGVGLGINIDDNYLLTPGIFTEASKGSYDTDNSFNGQNYDGSGDFDSYSFGTMLKYEYQGLSGLTPYAEASLRLGRLHNEYTNGHLTSGGIAAKYNRSSTFTGFHLGAGIILDVTDSVSLDLNAKYLYLKFRPYIITTR